MSTSASKKSRKKSKRINPHQTRVRYSKVVTCMYCEAQIYKRHLGAHIRQFHAERSSSQPAKSPSGDGMKGIDLSELSPEMRREIIEKYFVNESGVMVAFNGYEHSNLSDGGNDKKHEEKGDPSWD